MPDANPSAEAFDVVILGAGPAGERAAIQAAREKRRVALLERESVVGGHRVNWGTIPSKTLRESALFVHNLTRNRLHGIRVEVAEEVTVADFMHRQRQVVQQELELINESLGRYRIRLLRGHGTFVDPFTVQVAPRQGAPYRVTGKTIVIATGSSPNRPPDVPFDGEAVFDSTTILSLPRMPKSLVVMGAGVIGVEYASIFAALGLDVMLLDTRDRLLPYLDREIVRAFQRELGRLGVVIRHDQRYERIERQKDGQVCCHMQGGGTFEADALLYCVGRDGHTKDLGLEAIGLVPNKYGQLEVNEHYQTSHPHIYAVGDVVGYPALASTAMEQGRAAIRHALGLRSRLTKPEDLPFAIYSIPEVSYIGLTEETARERGIDYVIGHGNYELNPRGQIIGEHGGLLKLVFEAEKGRLIGVHVVGAGASELVHIGQAYLRSGATAEQMADTLYNYPTLSDMYRHAALVAVGRLAKKAG
jgi:NAD(P) transhydrogenase